MSFFWGENRSTTVTFFFRSVFIFFLVWFFVKEKGNAYWKSLTTEAKKGASTKTFALDQ